MKQFLRLFYDGEGQGNIGYNFPAGTAAGVLNNANDGLSTDAATGKIAQLGQTVGRAGNPAILLEDREIPNLNNKVIYIGRHNFADNVLSLDSNHGFGVSNNTGDAFAAVWTIAAVGASWRVATQDANEIDMEFLSTNVGGGAAHIIYNRSDLGSPDRFDTDRPFVATALGTGVAPVVGSVVGPNYNWDPSAGGTAAVVLDAGNLNINIDALAIINQFGIVKKKGADVNTITLTNTTPGGVIWGGGATGATTFVFSDPGESIMFQSDGLDLLII